MGWTTCWRMRMRLRSLLRDGCREEFGETGQAETERDPEVGGEASGGATAAGVKWRESAGMSRHIAQQLPRLPPVKIILHLPQLP